MPFTYKIQFLYSVALRVPRQFMEDAWQGKTSDECNHLLGKLISETVEKIAPEGSELIVGPMKEFPNSRFPEGWSAPVDSIGRWSDRLADLVKDAPEIAFNGGPIYANGDCRVTFEKMPEFGWRDHPGNLNVPDRRPGEEGYPSSRHDGDPLKPESGPLSRKLFFFVLVPLGIVVFGFCAGFAQAYISKMLIP